MLCYADEKSDSGECLGRGKHDREDMWPEDWFDWIGISRDVRWCLS